MIEVKRESKVVPPISEIEISKGGRDRKLVVVHKADSWQGGLHFKISDPNWRHEAKFNSYTRFGAEFGFVVDGKDIPCLIEALTEMAEEYE